MSEHQTIIPHLSKQLIHKKILFGHARDDIHKGRNTMKKISMLLMSVLVVFVLAACGMNNNNKDTTKNDADENRAAEDERGKTTETEKDRDDNADANDAVDNGVDHNGESRLDLAEDVAEKVTELDEVDNATVILSNRNAYVAVVMDNDNTNTNAEDTTREDELPKDLEDKISDKVREVKTDVDNVYVSLNPDFVERMRGYGTRIKEGEPIEGFFEEFGEAVRNVFPDAH